MMDSSKKILRMIQSHMFNFGPVLFYAHGIYRNFLYFLFSKFNDDILIEFFFVFFGFLTQKGESFTMCR